MNSKKVVLASSLLVCLIFAVVIAIHAQQSAGVQMAQPGADITSGKSLVLEVALNEPLPTDSSVIARVRPDSASQQVIQLQSSTPDDSNRKSSLSKQSCQPQLHLANGAWKACSSLCPARSNGRTLTTTH